jgi:DNA-binding CsgD family transcriptional regulator
LTPRECEVLALLGRGCSNREIAAELVIGVRTVETHVERILRKLDLPSRSHAMLWINQRGSLIGEPGSAPESHLPVALTTFIGRENECRLVRELLNQSRLVTLTGVGGVGKTRLALQTAGQLDGSYRDGVWFVDFARHAQPELVPHVVATTIGICEEPGTRFCLHS